VLYLLTVLSDFQRGNGMYRLLDEKIHYRPYSYLIDLLIIIDGGMLLYPGFRTGG
jgi:hypothetical protein